MTNTCKDCEYFSHIGICEDGICKKTGCAQTNRTSACKCFKFALITCLLFFVCSVSAQTRAQVAAELQRQGVPHAEIVLAQARHETGNFTSRLCRVNHNLFGIKHNGKYAKYSNWKASIKDYKERISSRYTGGDYYAFLRRIKYASDVRYCDRIKNIVRTSK